MSRRRLCKADSVAAEEPASSLFRAEAIAEDRRVRVDEIVLMAPLPTYAVTAVLAATAVLGLLTAVLVPITRVEHVEGRLASCEVAAIRAVDAYARPRSAADEGAYSGPRCQVHLDVPPAFASLLEVGSALEIHFDGFPEAEYGIGHAVVTAVAYGAGAADGSTGGREQRPFLRVQGEMAEVGPGPLAGFVADGVAVTARIVGDSRSLYRMISR